MECFLLVICEACGGLGYRDGEDRGTWHKAGKTARQSQEPQPHARTLAGRSAWPCSNLLAPGVMLRQEGPTPNPAVQDALS